MKKNIKKKISGKIILGGPKIILASGKIISFFAPAWYSEGRTCMTRGPQLPNVPREKPVWRGVPNDILDVYIWMFESFVWHFSNVCIKYFPMKKLLYLLLDRS